MDAVTATLLDLLRKAASHEHEQPLFKVGRMEGLAANRQGQVRAAADRALAEGFLEVVREEAKGKQDVAWVRITPIGRRFLADQESPARLLKDVVQALQLHHDGQPRWIADLRAQLRALEQRLDDAIREQQERLADLHQRVAMALEKLDRERLPTSLRLPAWQADLLSILDHRGRSGLPREASLAELHHQLRDKGYALPIAEYHQGLLRLANAGLLHLIPAKLPLPDVPEPEFTLAEGGKTYLSLCLPS